MKSINSQKSRNAGLIAFGAMVAFVAWNFVGFYCIAASILAGVATFINDKLKDNDPKLTDPLCTFVGGILIVALIYFTINYGHSKENPVNLSTGSTISNLIK